MEYARATTTTDNDNDNDNEHFFHDNDHSDYFHNCSTNFDNDWSDDDAGAADYFRGITAMKSILSFLTPQHPYATRSHTKRTTSLRRSVLPLIVVLLLASSLNATSILAADGSSGGAVHDTVTPSYDPAPNIGFSPPEFFGGGSPVEHCGECHDSPYRPTVTFPNLDPQTNVDPLSGDLTETYTAFSAPALGGPLDFGLTYDAQRAQEELASGLSYAGPFGWGWFADDLSEVQLSGEARVVNEENGAQVVFIPLTAMGAGKTSDCDDTTGWGNKTAPVAGSPTFCAPDRIDALFGETSESYVLYEQGGLKILTYSLDGPLLWQGNLDNSELLTWSYPTAGSSGCPSSVETSASPLTIAFVSSCAIITDTSTPPRTVTQVYGDFGNLIETIDPSGTNVVQATINSGEQLLNLWYGSVSSSWRQYAFTYTGTSHYANDLHTVTDANLHTTTINWSTAGQVDNEVDAVGTGTTAFGYNCKVNGIDSIAVPCLAPPTDTDTYFETTTVATPEATNTYTYTDGAPQTVDMGGSTTTTFSYSGPEDNQTIITTDPDGHQTTEELDEVGNVLQFTNQGSETTTTEYNGFDEPCWSAPPGVGYPGSPGNGDSCADAPSFGEGATNDFYNDSDGTLEESFDGNGDETEYGYYPGTTLLCWSSEPTSVPMTLPDCSTSDPAYSFPGETLYIYDNNHEVRDVDSPDGTYASPSYDQTVYDYDNDGLLDNETQPDGGGVTGGDYTTEYQYGVGGRLIQMIAPVKASTGGGIDYETTTYGWDLAGNLLSETLATSGSSTYVTQAAYDADNRTCWVLQAASVGSLSCNSYPSGSQQYTYRPASSIVATSTDPDGNMTQYSYALSGYPDEPTSIEDPMGNWTTNVYDADGSMCETGTSTTNYWAGTALTCPVSSSDQLGPTFTLYFLDEFEDPSLVVSPNGNVTFNTYSNVDFPHNPTEVYSSNNDIHYTYDFNGHVTNTDKNKGDISEAYDANGNPCWRETEDITIIDSQSPYNSCNNGPPDTSYGTTSWIWFPSQRLKKVTEYDMSGDAALSTYTYDANGNVLQRTDENGNSMEYAYNYANEPTCIGYPVAEAGLTDSCSESPSASNTVVNYKYDVDERMTLLTDWEGTTDSFVYKTPATTVTPSEVGTINFGGSASPINTVSLGYDADTKLTSESYGAWTNQAGATTTWMPNADEMYESENSKSISYTPQQYLSTYGTHSFTEDSSGNVTQDAGSTNTSTYAYSEGLGAGGDNQVTESQTTSPASATCYGYDGDGSRSSAYSIVPGGSCSSSTGATKYHYNTYDELDTCTSGSDGPAGCGLSSAPTLDSYDSSGLRYLETQGPTTNEFDWDTTQTAPRLLLDQSSSGGYAFIYGPPVFGAATPPLEQIKLNVSGTGVMFLASDPQGPRYMFDTSDKLHQSYTYAAFGAETTTNVSGSSSTSIGFEGGFVDASGFIYYQARYYDPSTDQFLSVDPDVNVTDQPYQYAGSDPVSAGDPSGLYTGYCDPGDCPTSSGSDVPINETGSAGNCCSSGTVGTPSGNVGNPWGEANTSPEVQAAIASSQVDESADEMVQLYNAEQAFTQFTNDLRLSSCFFGSNSDANGCAGFGTVSRIGAFLGDAQLGVDGGTAISAAFIGPDVISIPTGLAASELLGAGSLTATCLASLSNSPQGTADGESCSAGIQTASSSGGLFDTPKELDQFAQSARAVTNTAVDYGSWLLSRAGL